LGGEVDSQRDHPSIEEENNIEEGKLDKSGGRKEREKNIGEEVKRNDQEGEELRKMDSPAE
jgi:hypothetical protein